MYTTGTGTRSDIGKLENACVSSTDEASLLYNGETITARFPVKGLVIITSLTAKACVSSWASMKHADATSIHVQRLGRFKLAALK